LGEGRGKAFVEVLGCVHHDRQTLWRARETLSGGETKRLLVHIENVGNDLLDNPREVRLTRIGVAVDIPRTPHRQFNDLELIREPLTVARPFPRPIARGYEYHVDTGAQQGTLPIAMRGVTTSVVDPKNPQGDVY
jgi:hypothetical protein